MTKNSLIASSLLIISLFIPNCAYSGEPAAEKTPTIDIKSKISNTLFYECILDEGYFLCKNFPLRLEANKFIIVRDGREENKKKIKFKNGNNDFQEPFGEIPPYGNAFD